MRCIWGHRPQERCARTSSWAGDASNFHVIMGFAVLKCNFKIELKKMQMLCGMIQRLRVNEMKAFMRLR